MTTPATSVQPTHEEALRSALSSRARHARTRYPRRSRSGGVLC